MKPNYAIRVWSDGVSVRYRLDDGLITACSDWTIIYALEDLGRITHKFYPGCYGHTDFYIIR